MSEEIDIIELLRLVKEEKAPKRISINNLEYCYEDETTFGDYYRDTEKYGKVFFSNEYDLRAMANAKIKILDKPIIPELPKINQNEYDTNSSYRALVAYENRYVINTIIRHINKEEK